MNKTSPRVLARFTGAFYLLTILAGIFAQGFVSNKLVIFGDPATTATNIMTHRGLWQLGFAVYMIEMTAQIVTTALFYRLLAPVNRSVALAAAFVSLAGCTVKAFSRVFFIAPLLLLDGAHHASAFNPAQLHSLVLLSLEINSRGAGMAMAFFGFYALAEGYLVLRSTFLPRILGALTLISGVGWLTFLSPTLGNRLFFSIAPF